MSGFYSHIFQILSHYFSYHWDQWVFLLFHMNNFYFPDVTIQGLVILAKLYMYIHSDIVITKWPQSFPVPVSISSAVWLCRCPMNRESLFLYSWVWIGTWFALDSSMSLCQFWTKASWYIFIHSQLPFQQAQACLLSDGRRSTIKMSCLSWSHHRQPVCS